MKSITIREARRFSSQAIQKVDLLKSHDLHLRLLCFEAGQKGDEGAPPFDLVYQVLEGEALISAAGETGQRLGKGKLLLLPAGTSHSLENAGGGLLVIMATGRPE